MTYNKFSTMAKRKEKDFGSLTIKQAEDLFWDAQRMEKKRPYYGLDNEFSLFGDGCNMWNINKFTHVESLLHQVIYYFVLICSCCL